MSFRNLKLATGSAWKMLVGFLVCLLSGKSGHRAFKEGVFRNSGEVHRWLYDRFSLSRLLQQAGLIDIRSCTADESSIPDFATYNLDVLHGKIRKPDSLFMEAIKPFPRGPNEESL